MSYDLKTGLIKLNAESKTVLHNLDLFVESAALINVALMTYLGITSKVNLTTLNTFGKWATIGSCVVIAFRGSWQFLRFLDNK